MLMDRQKGNIHGKIIRRVSAAALAAMLAFGSFSAFAAEKEAVEGVADFESGSASVTVQGNGGQSLAGKKFKVYRIFNAENSKGGESINYTWNNDFKIAVQNAVAPKLSPPKDDPTQVTEYEAIDYIQSLSNNKVEGATEKQKEEGRYSEFRYFVEALRDEIEKLGEEVGDTVTVISADEGNKVKISGLPYGYYLIDEVTDVTGQDAAASLCMVNTANPDVDINIKSDYPAVTKKIQEDDDQGTIGNGGYNDIGDYEIGQNVPYKFESKIPNINGYDTYLYKWHDKMDPALTLNKETLKIQISDGQTTYDVKADEEYTLNTETGDDETFTVEIADIKAIIDREFNKLNEQQENTYGQTVTLTYTATLNDTAADNLGRAGYENDVRLEFSNDADSDGDGKTGLTPWDTVVCFSFGLNISKENQNGVKLEGAKFRLYYDENCTDEVYVKSTGSGYNVISKDTAKGSRPGEAVEMATDTNGSIVINGIDSDVYYLKETAAPAGYRKIDDPIKVSVDATYVSDRNSYVKGTGAAEGALINLAGTAHIKKFLGGLFNETDPALTGDVEAGTLNLTVVNNTGSKLPATGSVMMILLLAAGTGLVIYSVRSGRNKKETA